MRKLLLLVFVAVMCVPCYGDILVYKTSSKATVFDTTGPTKEAEKGFLVLDVDLGTQTVSSAQQITYGATGQQVNAATVVFNTMGDYIVAEYACGDNDAILFGKIATIPDIGSAAKSLKGSMLVSNDVLGSGTFSATLDSKKTKTVGEGDSITDIVTDITDSLIDKYGEPVADTTAPTPNPMTWAVEPNATSTTTITMTASTATDTGNPPVEYFFTNVTDTGHNSGWITVPEFTDSGLTPDTNYTYTVKARDSAAALNETTASDPRSATTPKVADTNAPEPNRMEWDVNGEPEAISASAITMTAALATDAQGPVQYYFTCANDGNFDSGWKSATVDSTGWTASTRTFIASGLAPATSYVFTVKAKDNALVANITEDSNQASATTDADANAPTPDPMTFATVPEANGATSIYMVATTATDDTNSAGVLYSFECVLNPGGGTNSGWQASPIYQDTSLTPDTEYAYRVRAKDATGNTTGYSSIATATTGKTITIMIAEEVAAHPGVAVTVTVPPGTYNEDVVITDPCVTLLSSAGAGSTTIQTATTDPGISIEANYVTIGGSTGHGFTINSINAADQDGVADSVMIVQRNVAHTNISYNTIIANGATHYCLVAAAGAKNLLISNNNFSGDGETITVGGFGIMRMNQVNDINVNNNIADGGSSAHVHYGFQVNGCVGPAYFGENTITDINARGAGIYVTSGEDGVDGIVYTAGLEQMTIHNNTISGCKRGILVVDEYSNPGEINNVTITNNTLQNNVTGIDIGYNAGLVGTAAKYILAEFVVTDNSFLNNITNQISNTVTATTLPAELNWWGAASGPYNATLNPGGTAGSVTDLVDFTPWYTTSAMDVNSAD